MTTHRRGRPPGPTGRARTGLVKIRVTEAELAALREAAEREGVTLSEWARTILLEIAKQ